MMIKCESVSRVLWEYPIYNTLRSDFMCKLQELLGDGVDSLDSFQKNIFC